MKKGQLNFFS